MGRQRSPARSSGGSTSDGGSWRPRRSPPVGARTRSRPCSLTVSGRRTRPVPRPWRAARDAARGRGPGRPLRGPGSPRRACLPRPSPSSPPRSARAPGWRTPQWVPAGTSSQAARNGPTRSSSPGSPHVPASWRCSSGSRIHPTSRSATLPPSSRSRRPASRPGGPACASSWQARSRRRRCSTPGAPRSSSQAPGTDRRTGGPG